MEAADVIILNKIDLSKGEQLDTAKVVVRSLNEKAELIETKFGELSPETIIGNVLCDSFEVDDGHSHSHDHDSDTHAHVHHSQEHLTGVSCSNTECTDASHMHSHSHDHSTDASCSDPSCTDSSHTHNHSHDHSKDGSCSDPTCTDASHSHSHSHNTSTDRLGLSSFVYKSSRTFDSKKLFLVLLTWPIPVMEELNLGLLSEDME